jgi:hypothetical protein
MDDGSLGSDGLDRLGKSLAVKSPASTLTYSNCATKRADYPGLAMRVS